MSKWIIKGLNTGVVTSRYPAKDDDSPGISPGFPRGGTYGNDASELIADCPAGAIYKNGVELVVDRKHCIHCYRCLYGRKNPLGWEKGYEWGIKNNQSISFSSVFRRSAFIRVIDAGSCGACLNEVKLLNNPYYNMHRLGFFITPTPRQADILIVVGPVTEQMKNPLLKTYEAMPSPKGVIAVGACSLTGGIFGSSFITHSGVKNIIPVDIDVPGCPPPPLAILHGLLLITGRKQVQTNAGIPNNKGGMTK